MEEARQMVAALRMVSGWLNAGGTTSSSPEPM
jgi:hypothetical protein